jgi:hypothetical protein
MSEAKVNIETVNALNLGNIISKVNLSNWSSWRPLNDRIEVVLGKQINDYHKSGLAVAVQDYFDCLAQTGRPEQERVKFEFSSPTTWPNAFKQFDESALPPRMDSCLKDKKALVQFR